jgi:hypothetical protein
VLLSLSVALQQRSSSLMSLCNSIPEHYHGPPAGQVSDATGSPIEDHHAASPSSDIKHD